VNDIRRKIKWLAVLAVALLVGIFVWRQGRKPANNPVSIEGTNETATTEANKATPVRESPSTVVQEPNAITRSPEEAARSEQRQAVASERNVPIDFWGKVVDQNNSPLSGVRVTLRARTIAPSGEQTTAVFPTTNMVTGENGLFEIHGMNGDVLTIQSIQKDGYEPEPGSSRGFPYGHRQEFAPSANNPVVLTMWQTNLSQPLISRDLNSKLSSDGRNYSIDLKDGTITEGDTMSGDLQLSVKRPTTVQQGQKYDWLLTMKAPNGLRQELDAYSPMYIAPRDGYTNDFEFTRRGSESGWGSSSGDIRFYLRLRDNKYGKFTINVDSFFDGNIAGYALGDGKLSVHSWVNPTGSRVLR
jgi:hypothetical protein